MSKTVLIALIAGVIVIGAGAAYFATQKDDKTSNSTTETTTNASESTSPSTTKSNVASFLSGSETKECSYSTSSEGAEINGTMYFSGGQMRHNYSSNKDGKSQSGSMIITKEAQYVWDNDTLKGVKFAFSPDTPTSSDQPSGNSSQGVDVNKEYDFSCKDWAVDESYFTPPSNVKIQDLSNLQNQIPTTR